MTKFERRPHDARRWELSEEERARIAQEYEKPLSRHDLARLIVRNPRLALELLHAMGTGAIDAVRTGSSVMWTIDAARVRNVVPQAASGVSWSSESTFLEALLPRIAPGTRVMDLGCGAGRFARSVAPVVGEVICVDSSRLLLEEARVQLREYGNVSYVRNQGCTLVDIRDSSIDIVFSQGLFGYLDPREFVALAIETRRVLKPNGEFVFSAYTFTDEPSATWAGTSLRRVIERRRVHAGVPEPYTIDYLVALLGLAGFQVTDPRGINVDSTNGYAIFAMSACGRAAALH